MLSVNMRPEDFQKRFDVSHETLGKLQIYFDLLVKWQKAINLVSPKTIDQAWERHFADSAQLQILIPSNIKTIADLGSGAGFPGMVLAILNPKLQIHLIESDGRKCEFLRTVSRETSVHISIHNKRVEGILTDINPDLITARAFSSLLNIFDFACPVLAQKSNLSLLLLKGQGVEKEMEEARQKYEFSAQQTPSQTDKDARILLVSNLCEKESS